MTVALPTLHQPLFHVSFAHDEPGFCQWPIANTCSYAHTRTRDCLIGLISLDDIVAGQRRNHTTSISTGGTVLCGSIQFVVTILVLNTMTGCTLLKPAEKQNYETIAANPQYDTRTAEKAHAKALKILDNPICNPSKKLAEAEVHLQKAMVADVTFGPAHNTLGVVYMLRRQLYTAAWEFEYAAKLMPDRVEPIYNLGQLFEEADKLDNAIVYYEQAMALAPRDPAVIGSLACVQLKNGQTLDEVRPLLESLVFLDNRPEWIEWARDQLGRKPIQFVGSATDSESATEIPKSTPKLLHDLKPESVAPTVPTRPELNSLDVPSHDVPDPVPPPPPGLDSARIDDVPGRATMSSDSTR